LTRETQAEPGLAQPGARQILTTTAKAELMAGLTDHPLVPWEKALQSSGDSANRVIFSNLLLTLR
jgi:hypothetical protein